MMNVTFKANMRGMKESVDLSAAEMKMIGIKARKKMQARLNKGKDVNDSKLKEYSKGYKRYKRNLGKNPNIVNMEDSGTMRNSISFDAKKNQVELFPNFHKKIGYWHQTGRAKGGKVREWFGVSKKNEKHVLKDIDKAMDRKIKRWNAK